RLTDCPVVLGLLAGQEGARRLNLGDTGLRSATFLKHMKCSTCVLLLVLALMSLSCCCHNHSPERRSKAPVDRVLVEGQTGCAENPLKVTPVVQEATFSCWAACGQMIMDYVRRQSPLWQAVPAPRQCEQAIKEYPTDCAGCCDAQMHMLCS